MELNFTVARLCGHMGGRENTFKAVESYLESLNEQKITIILDNKDDAVLGDDECVIVVTPDCVDLQAYRRMEQARMQNRDILFWDGERLNTSAYVNFFGFQIVNPSQAPVLNPGRFGVGVKTLSRPKFDASKVYPGVR